MNETVLAILISCRQIRAAYGRLSHELNVLQGTASERVLTLAIMGLHLPALFSSLKKRAEVKDDQYAMEHELTT